jgi:hypothetical protein
MKGKKNSLGESFYLSLFLASLSDVASVSAYPDVEYDRDKREIVNRFRKEGLSFLTKTMPSLGKAIDIALATGTPLRCRGFRLKRGTQIPQFLGCLIGGVFDPSGRERSDASPDILKWLRQLTYELYKLAVPTTEEQNEEIISSFKNNDTDLPDYCPIYTDGSERTHTHGYRQAAARVLSAGKSDGADVTLRSTSSRGGWILDRARRLVCRVVGMSLPIGADFAPRHGPGSVAGGEKPHEKTIEFVDYAGLSKVFPYCEYFMYNISHICDTYQAFLPLEPKRSGTAKVVLVPKDSRGPRLISAEPKEYQWIQQGLRVPLEKAIEDCYLTRGHVNFRDQDVNRNLALAASDGAPWATLDMKDASDRVSLALVQALFPEPWLSCLIAARSDSTRLPSGEVFPMKKFAPMGSSLCFPVESLVFWALSVAAILQAHPHLNAYQASRRVFVFGDDLIVNLQDQEIVRSALPLFKLMFNESKCCTAGHFRESCGMDAYKGVCVTPLRVKCLFNRRSGMSLVSYAAIHNAAIDLGMYNLADYLSGEILKSIRLPYSDSTDKPYVCLVDPRKTASQIKSHNSYFSRRFSKRLHRTEMRTWGVCSRPYKAATPGWSEMLRVRSLTSPHEANLRLAPASTDRGLLPFEYEDKLFLPRPLVVRAYQYAAPRQAILKRGWYEA